MSNLVQMKLQIYSSCEESYRLTETGELHIPPEYTDQYCRGPCLEETHHVLNCLQNILSRFRFYNKATIRAVEETIKEGCSYGPKRGLTFSTLLFARFELIYIR